MGITDKTKNEKEGLYVSGRNIQYFTNRNAEIKRFCELLHRRNEHGSVLMFYGKGGHGKSSLLHELKTEYSFTLTETNWEKLSLTKFGEECFKENFKKLTDNAKRSKHILFLDFRMEAESIISPWEKYLLKICHQLDYFTFPRFYFAYQLYRKIESNPISEAEKNQHFNNHDFKFWVDMLSQFTWGGLPGLTNKAWGYIEPKLTTNRAQAAFKDGEFLKSLFRMRDKEPHKIAEMLPQYLGEDIADNLEKSGNELLLFVDTFEALAGEERDIVTTAERERQKWFVTFCNELLVYRKALVIVAGRDKLDWTSFSSEWKNNEFLEQHLVEPIGKPDTFLYLETGKIDKSLFEPIYDLTGGVPIWLGLIVDYALFFWENEKRKLQLNDLSIDIGKRMQEEDILAQLLSYICKLEPTQEKLLTYLALCKSFNKQTYEWIGVAFGFSTTPEKYERIKKMTFVYEHPLAEDAVIYHSLVSALLKKRIDLLTSKEVHNLLQKKHFQALTEAHDEELQFDHICNGIYHAMSLNQDWSIFDNYFNTYLETYKLEQARELHEWLPDALLMTEENIDRLQKLGKKYKTNGQLRLAFEIFLRSNKIITFRVESTTRKMAAQVKQAESYLELAKVSSSIQSLEQTKSYYIKSLEISRTILKEYPNKKEALRCNAKSLYKLGHIYMDIGALDKTKKHFEQGLDVALKLAKYDKTSFEDQNPLSCCYDGLARYYKVTGDSLNALKHYQNSFACSQTILEYNAINVDALSDHAKSCSSMGNVYCDIGDTTKTLKYFQDSLNIRKKLVDLDNDDALAQSDLASSFEEIGLLYHRMTGSTSETYSSYLSSLHIREKLAKIDKGNIGFQKRLASNYIGLGYISSLNGNMSESLVFYRKAHKIYESCVYADPDDSLSQVNLAKCFSHIGRTMRSSGDLVGSLEYYQQGFMIFRKLANKEPQDATAQQSLSFSLHEIGAVYFDMDKLNEAREHFVNATKICKKLLQMDEKNTTIKMSLSSLLGSLGNICSSTGKLSSAIKYLKESLQMREILFNEDENNQLYEFDIADSHIGIADIYRKSGDLEKRKKHLHLALDIRKRFALKNDKDMSAQQNLVRVYATLGYLYEDFKEWKKAVHYFRNSLKLLENAVEKDQTNTQARKSVAEVCGRLGIVFYRIGDFDSALIYFQKNFEILKGLVNNDFGNIGLQGDLNDAYGMLAQFYKDSGDLPKAVKYLTDCVKGAERVVSDNVESRTAQRTLSFWYCRLGSFIGEMKGANESKTFYDKSLRIIEDLSAESPNDVTLLAPLGKCYNGLATVYKMIGETEQYSKYLEKSYKTFLKNIELSKDDLGAQQNLSVSLAALGRLALNDDNYEKAEKYFNDGLSIRKKLANGKEATTDDHLNVAASYNVLPQLKT